MIKVEIGPGINRLGNDWIGVGPYAQSTVDHICMWGKDNLPFKDGSVDIIYASHVIEHIWWYKVNLALADVYRCLKQDGVVEIWTVNFSAVVQGYLNESCGDAYRAYNSENDFMRWVNGKIFSHGNPPTWAHHSCFDTISLKKELMKVGFEPFPLTIPRGINHDSNLGIGGIKR